MIKNRVFKVWKITTLKIRVKIYRSQKKNLKKLYKNQI